MYNNIYIKVDPNGYGRIGAMEAARFLKKSQLSDGILSKIWDMADPQSRGSLDKSGLFVALKLCALAQAGHDLSMNNLNLELPPPKMVRSNLNNLNKMLNFVSFLFTLLYFREIFLLYNKKMFQIHYL